MNDNVAEPFRSILAAIAGPHMTQKQQANEQRRMFLKNISKAGEELEILARELKDHPEDCQWDLLDGIHSLLGKAEANFQGLGGFRERDPDLLRADELATEREQRAARREP